MAAENLVGRFAGSCRERIDLKRDSHVYEDDQEPVAQNTLLRQGSRWLEPFGLMSAERAAAGGERNES